MKQIFTLFFCLVVTSAFTQSNKPNPSSVPPSGNQFSEPISNLTGQLQLNSVKEYQALVPVKTISDFNAIRDNYSSSLQSSTYFDGYGRPVQKVTRRQFSSGKDLVEVSSYNAWGEQEINPLPFVKSDNPGSFTRNIGSNLRQTYSDLGYAAENYLYTKTEFEESSERTPIKVFPQGNNWVGSNTYIKYQEGFSLGTTIPKYSIGGNASMLPTYLGNYEKLFTKITADEDGNQTVKVNYFDERGQLVCEGIYKNGTPAEKTETFYIYDVFGNLRVTVTPKGAEALAANGFNFSAQVLNGLCFINLYNEKGLVYAQKKPGVEPTYFVYNSDDRLVLSQEPNERNDLKWSFFKYDIQGRLVQKGICKLSYSSTTATSITTPFGVNLVFPSGSSIPYLPNELSNLVNNPTVGIDFLKYIGFSPISSFSDYQTSFTDVEVLLSNYYDSYQFSTIGFSQSLVNQTNGYQVAKTNDLRGRFTGSISSISNSSSKVTTILFYNNRGELIQNARRGINGQLTYESFGFDFRGLLKNYVSTHPGIITIYKRFTYDAYGRLTKAEHKLNGAQNYRTIGQYYYDNLGRLSVRKLGGMGYNVNYSYNIRNWLVGINKHYVALENSTDYFGMEISYDYGFDNTFKNGRIAGLKWRNKGTGKELRSYGYTYDYKGNLIHADYNQTSMNSPNAFIKTEKDFTMYNTTYDVNGNILSMAHKAASGIGNIITLDDLNYTYETGTNRLLAVSESSSSQSKNPTLHDGLGDFRDVSGTQDYSYDQNGNLKSDLNKGIQLIKQDWAGLNKPIEIQFNNGNTIKYYYDANGSLLRKTAFTQISNTTKSFDYIGDVVYANGALNMIHHGEGRVRINQAQGIYTYDYYIKDHIDNIRSIITESESNSIGSLGSGATGISWPDVGNPDQDPGNVLNLINSSLSSDTANSSGAPNLPVSYLATSEVVYAPIEEQLFDHLDDTRANRPLSEDTTNLYSANLNPSEGKIIGPGLMLKVMAGDQVELGVESFLSTTANTSSIPIQSLVYSLINALSGPMAAIDGISQAAQQAMLDVGTLTLSINELQHQNADTTKPMAFLNYLLFDETMQLLPEMSQAIQLSQSSAWQSTSTELFTIPQNGFLYVFSSNQSGISVRTDNLFVTHYTGALLEEFHYYPFGLVFEATKAPGLPTSSDYKYNHQFIEQNEFTDATGNLYGLNWYDFEFRTYDPQLGRWWQADPLMQHASPYLAMSNNPVLFTDPLGLWDSDVYGNEDEPYTAWRGIDENGRLLIGGTTGKIGFTLNHINFNGNYSSEQVSEQEFNQYMLNLQFIMGKTVSGLGFNQDVLGAEMTLGYFADDGESADWASATLDLIILDLRIIDATDAAWQKWVAYLFAGTAASAYIVYNAGDGNENYPGPWSYSFQHPTQNPTTNPPNGFNPNELPPELGPGIKWLIGGRMLYELRDEYQQRMSQIAPRDATRVIVQPRFIPKN
ncbi:MAG: DUF6443 domain-containing protein [Bacteroidia bacterium]|nr:DUF6443 domain-containing protein [Bacteroidia bacterium]